MVAMARWQEKVQIDLQYSAQSLQVYKRRLICQQETREYLDLAKMTQLVPVIGALAGLIVNYRLDHLLGTIAISAYRLRIRKKFQANSEMF